MEALAALLITPQKYHFFNQIPQQQLQNYEFRAANAPYTIFNTLIK